MGFVFFGLNRREKSLLAENVRPQTDRAAGDTRGYFYKVLRPLGALFILLKLGRKSRPSPLLMLLQNPTKTNEMQLFPTFSNDLAQYHARVLAPSVRALPVLYNQ